MGKPNAVMVNHQMRYKKKGQSIQPNQQIETNQFNTIAGTEEVPQAAGIRSKKNQYVSLNATQHLLNNSLEIQPNQAIIKNNNREIIMQKISASKINMRQNWQQIDNVRDNLNRTTLVKSVTKPTGQSGSYKLRADSMNFGKMASNFNETLEHPPIQTGKHRQSFKHTQHLNLQDFNENSPMNNFNNSNHHGGSVLNRRAGSQQWRNNSNFNNNSKSIGSKPDFSSNHIPIAQS